MAYRITTVVIQAYDANGLRIQVQGDKVNVHNRKFRNSLRTIPCCISTSGGFLQRTVPSVIILGGYTARPDADVTTGGWTSAPLWQKVDEP